MQRISQFFGKITKKQCPCPVYIYREIYQNKHFLIQCKRVKYVIPNSITLLIHNINGQRLGKLFYVVDQSISISDFLLLISCQSYNKIHLYDPTLKSLNILKNIEAPLKNLIREGFLFIYLLVE